MTRQNLLHYAKVLIVLLIIGYVQIMYDNKSAVPRYKNGQAKSYGAYKNGLPEGKWTWWFVDGEKMSEGYFYRGKRTGEWTTWFAEGGQKSRGNYKDDKLDGEYLKWYSSGVLAFEGSYIRDKLDGLQQYYDTAGDPEKTVRYAMGKRTSESITR